MLFIVLFIFIGCNIQPRFKMYSIEELSAYQVFKNSQNYINYNDYIDTFIINMNTNEKKKLLSLVEEKKIYKKVITGQTQVAKNIPNRNTKKYNTDDEDTEEEEEIETTTDEETDTDEDQTDDEKNENNKQGSKGSSKKNDNKECSDEDRGPGWTIIITVLIAILCIVLVLYFGLYLILSVSI